MDESLRMQNERSFLSRTLIFFALFFALASTAMFLSPNLMMDVDSLMDKYSTKSQNQMLGTEQLASRPKRRWYLDPFPTQQSIPESFVITVTQRPEVQQCVIEKCGDGNLTTPGRMTQASIPLPATEQPIAQEIPTVQQVSTQLPNGRQLTAQERIAGPPVTTEEPATGQVNAQQASTQLPAAQQPITQELPTAQKASTQLPPAAQQPTQELPTPQKAFLQLPAAQLAVPDLPTAQQAFTQLPTAQQPFSAEQRIPQQVFIQLPTAQQPIPQELLTSQQTFTQLLTTQQHVAFILNAGTAPPKKLADEQTILHASTPSLITQRLTFQELSTEMVIPILSTAFTSSHCFPDFDGYCELELCE